MSLATTTRKRSSSTGDTTTLDSPVGTLRAFGGQAGLQGLVWAESDQRGIFGSDWRETEPANVPLFATLQRQLDEYFAGHRQSFSLPLDPRGTEFQLLAWRALRAIPFGETRTYAQQARSIGKPSATRAVGAANGRNPLAIVVPCHRVIGANGQLTGFAAGLDAKRFLLNHEATVLGETTGSIDDR